MLQRSMKLVGKVNLILGDNLIFLEKETIVAIKIVRTGRTHFSIGSSSLRDDFAYSPETERKEARVNSSCCLLREVDRARGFYFLLIKHVN